MNKLRYTDVELSILKATFAENEPLLKAVRKVFLQLPLGEQDENELNVFKGNEELNRIMRKTFLPELDGDTPLGQQIDLWMILNIIEKTPEEAEPHMAAREWVINYIEQGLDALQGEIDINNRWILETFIPKLVNNESEPNAKVLYSKLIARNTIVQHVEMVLNQINFLAGLKTETTEETKKRLMKDSNK